MKTLLLLIRREFWEHRALWIAPLVLAACYPLLVSIPAEMHAGPFRAGGTVELNGGPNLVLGVQFVFTFSLLALMSIVIFFYLADCLYSERKDRSILFWKSLPVSDSATVLSKLLVAMVVVPLGVYLIGLAANLLMFGVLRARFQADPVLGQALRLEPGAWLRLNLHLLTTMIILSLWYLPFAAYQLLVSAWAKSSIAAWTLLPPIALALAESFVFGTHYVRQTLLVRTVPGMILNDGVSMSGGEKLLPALADPSLWIGIAVAVLLVYAAIRVRRYRDDT